MSFTTEELKVCKDNLGEEQAKAIGSLPSSFGAISGQNEIVRVFEIPTSEDISLLLRFLETLTSSKAIAGDFTAAAECLTVADPMCDGQTKPGTYRNSSVKLYRQKNAKNGTEFFYLVQTLRQGYVTTVQTHYEFASASTDATALNGLKFVDSGETLNTKKIHHDTTGVYAKWYDGQQWVVSLIGSVDADLTPEPYPATVTVSGTGAGEYAYSGIANDRPVFGSLLNNTDGVWILYNENGDTLGTVTSNAYNPPKLGWSGGQTLAYTDPDNYFSCATEAGNYIGKGGWTGTVAVSALTSPQYDFSEFIIADGNLWHSGASTTILKLRNVNPDYVEQIRAELQASATFSDLATRYDTVTGTQYYISTKPQPEEDDSYSILLLLSKHNNSDLYFKFQSAPDVIRGFFYKWEATDTTLAELMVTKQFGTTGAIVTSGGKTLQEVVAGRTVNMRRTVRDPEDRLFDVEIEITWTAAYTLAEASAAITFQKFAGASVTVDQGFGIPDSLLPNYSAHYLPVSSGGDLAENQLGNFQFERDQENGTFRFTASVTTLTGRQGYLDAGEKWIFYGSQVMSTTAIEVPVSIDASGYRTLAQLKTLSGFKVDGSLSFSTETGLAAYNLQITKNGSASSFVAGHSASAIEQKWVENGRGPVLPVDIESTYDTINGLWYEVVEFDFDGVAGNYTWKKRVTRYQVPDVGYVHYSSAVSPMKDDKVINRTFQATRLKNRGSWKEEAVAWNDLWEYSDSTYYADHADGHVVFYPATGLLYKKILGAVAGTPPTTEGYWEVTTDAPTCWVSMGYQALYGNWQPWFVKGSRIVVTGGTDEANARGMGDDFGVFIGRKGTGNCRYNPDRFGQKPLHWSQKIKDGGTDGSGLGVLGMNALDGNASVHQVERNLVYTYSVPAYGYSWYDHEVLLIKKYKTRREFMRWCSAFDGYEPGGANAGDTPPDWEANGYLARYGAWNPNYCPSTASSGDDCGTLIGLSGTAVQRYQPTPQNIGLNWTQADSQSGVLGMNMVDGNATIHQVERNLDYAYTTPAYGYSVYNHVLAESMVLANSGEPELDADTGVQYSANAYEQPAFCVIGKRLRRTVSTQITRKYMTVNPALLTVNPIPSIEAARAESTSNKEVSYKPVHEKDLWAIEKMVVEYSEWEADKFEVEADGTVRNFPQVNDCGTYMYYEFPTATNSVTGKDVTAGKVSNPRTVYD